MKKLQTYVSTYSRGKSHFEADGTEDYLQFQPIYRYYKSVAGLVVIITCIFGNLKDYLMKIVKLLIQLIINSIHNKVILVLKED